MYVNVALPIPAQRLFTYRIDPQFPSAETVVGCRVLVPFGQRTLTGVVVEVVEHPSLQETAIKPILEILDSEPVFSSALLRFTRWIAEYYFCSWGEVLKAALPQGMTPTSVLRVLPKLTISEEQLEQLRRRAPRQAAILDVLLHHPNGVSLRFLQQQLGNGGLMAPLEALEQKGYIERVQRVSSAVREKRQKAVTVLPEILEDSDRFRQVLEQLERSAPKQALVFSALYLHQLNQPEEPVYIGTLLREFHVSYATIKALIDKGYVLEYEAEVLRVADGVVSEPVLATKDELALPLTIEQQHAVDRVREALRGEEFKTFLLYGVTGSGKTLVYFHVIREVLQRGKSVLFLVPEVSLTPQLIDRFRNAFAETIAVFHSKMSVGERYDAWQMARQGRARIVIGTRSAIFVPVSNLGIIIVDEEHDASYKQVAPAPRYHARDCAIVRGSLEKVVVLLGSATPALESMYNAQTGKYHLLEIHTRADGAKLPKVVVVDMRHLYRERKVIGSISLPLLERIMERLDRKEGIIILQNRRGFTTRQECTNCGYVFQCPHCSVALTYHKFRQQLRCHYCGYHSPVLEQCPQCRSSQLRMVGRGTQRVEQELEQLLSQYGYSARIERVDLDSITTRSKLRSVFEQFAQRQIDILVGTQMIAKGLDFPHVTLVGIVNADLLLYLPDFRAAERTFQLLTQVAGRAGRSSGAPGEVIIQTLHPSHPVMQALQAHRYELFYSDELQLRRQAQYPPFVRFVLIEFSSKDESKVERAAHRFALLLPRKHPVVQILGPAVPPIARLRGYYRRIIAIKNFKETDPLGGQLQKMLNRAFRIYHQKYASSAVRYIVDVDVQSVL